MQLSQDKQKALEAFNQFILNPTDRTMVINGGAGTGKTVLIPHIVTSFIDLNSALKLIKPDHPDVDMYDIVISATTHKALKVVNDATKDFKLLRETKTLHSLLGLKHYYDRKGESKFTLNAKHDLGAFFSEKRLNLLVIDEASYIGEDLFCHIQIALNAFPNLKIVYIGDKRQAKPVNEDISPIFKYADVYVELTERFRFPHGGTIHSNAIKVESSIDTGLDLPPFTFDDKFEILGKARFINKVNTEIISKGMDTKIIAYHNHTCIKYNNDIHSVMYDSDRYVRGQQVIANTSHKCRGHAIQNETTLTVQKIYEPEIVEGILAYGIQFNHYLPTLFIPLNASELKEKLQEAASQRQWAKFMYLKELFIDVRPNWAMTSHKSQGSTFDNVIVDFNDLACAPKEDFLYLLNVAITRARNKVYIYREDLP